MTNEQKEFIQCLTTNNKKLNKEILILKHKVKDMELVKKVMVDVCSMFDVVIQLQKPFAVYNIYLKEKCYRWRVNRIKRGLPYVIEDNGEFLRAYSQVEENDKYLMCEFYLHAFFLSINANSFLTYFLEMYNLESLLQ